MVPSIYVENCNSTTVFLIKIISRCVVIIMTYGNEIFLRNTMPRDVLVSISKNAKIYKYIGSIIGKCNN